MKWLQFVVWGDFKINKHVIGTENKKNGNFDADSLAIDYETAEFNRLN